MCRGHGVVCLVTSRFMISSLGGPKTVNSNIRQTSTHKSFSCAFFHPLSSDIFHSLAVMPCVCFCKCEILDLELEKVWGM